MFMRDVRRSVVGVGAWWGEALEDATYMLGPHMTVETLHVSHPAPPFCFRHILVRVCVVWTGYSYVHIPAYIRARGTRSDLLDKLLLERFCH